MFKIQIYLISFFSYFLSSLFRAATRMIFSEIENLKRFSKKTWIFIFLSTHASTQIRIRTSKNSYQPDSQTQMNHLTRSRKVFAKNCEFSIKQDYRMWILKKFSRTYVVVYSKLLIWSVRGLLSSVIVKIQGTFQGLLFSVHYFSLFTRSF